MTGGPGALGDRDEVVERHHLAGVGAHVVAVQVAAVMRKGWSACTKTR